MKKRVLSILLCVIMLCGLLPTAALADENAPANEEPPQITVEGGGSLNVVEGVTIAPVQDACITAYSGATIKGIPLYGESTDEMKSDKSDSYSYYSYTVPTSTYVEKFIYLVSGENGAPIHKWVLYSNPEEPTYTVDFGSGSWTVGDVTVAAEIDNVNLNNVQSTGDNKVLYKFTEEAGITLTSFNPDTMEVRLTAADGFSTTLEVTNNQTSLSAKTNDGVLPNELSFAVVAKDSGGGGNSGAPAEEDFTSVIWNGDQVELTSDHGTISIASIDIGNNTYTYDSTTGKFVGVPEGLLLECYDDPSGESGVRIGDSAFAGNETLPKDPGFDQYAPQDGDPLRREDYDPAYTPWVYINFVFKPDYGYQVTGIGTNAEPTSLVEAGFAATETISTFRFPVYYRNMVHFVVLFSESDHVIAENSSKVNSAAIDDGENEIADSGNLKLNVTDLSGNDLKDAEAFAGQLGDSEAAENIMYLDVDLYQIVSKSNNDATDMYWETPLTDLGDNTVSITLNVSADPNATYYVIREHEDEDGTVTYTRVQATNNGDGAITFETNRFSTYALISDKAPTPSTPATPSRPSRPSIPTTPGTPTNDEIDIPISGDDETIRVGATVSGDTVTVDEIDMDQLDGVLGSEVSTGTVTIDFSEIDSTASVTTVELPANVVKEIAEAVNDPENDAESLEIVMPSGVSITFDADALSEKVSQADGADITISIESHEDADLTDAQKDAVGSRPAFDINVTSGGKHISDMGGKITIGAPYELKPNEKENGLVVWYVDDESNRERCQGRYDPVNKRMNWETDHLSLYMIDYCPTATFADLNIDAWYADSTDFVIENGLMNGYSDNTFRPNNTCTRAMIVTILWRLEGSPIVNYAMDFEDVGAEQWYTEALRWAASNKIAGGYGNGKFGTNDAITRGQMVTIMFRYAKYKGYDVSVGENTNILSYGDAFDVAEWAIPAMQWACGSGMIGGIADGSTMNLQPQGNATRAQAAAILQRYCENVAKGD